MAYVPSSQPSSPPLVCPGVSTADIDPKNSPVQAVSSTFPKTKASVPIIACDEIVQQQFIGSGAYGTVYRGCWRDQDVALKVFNLAGNQVNEEAVHLCGLSHQNIVRFYGICELGDHNFPALVMEYAYGGPLNLVLGQHPVLGPSTLLDWASQIAAGMNYLHVGPRLFHRDLKSSNILIRQQLTTKPYSPDELRNCILLITDFGMACRSSERSMAPQSKLGTLSYAAPEVCRQDGFTRKSDVWSFGVVLWELLTMDIPFKSIEPPRLMYIVAMYNATPYVPPDVPELFTKLLSDCWAPEPANRPEFQEILLRLEVANKCAFSIMDSSELSHIQAKWRESITEHYHRQHELSNHSSCSDDLSSRNLFDNEELDDVQRIRESLDRQQLELAEREHELGQKEEHYSRMGVQLLWMAIMAANQIKTPPTSTRVKSASRRRPLVPNLFRRWGSGRTEVGGESVRPQTRNRHKAVIDRSISESVGINSPRTNMVAQTCSASVVSHTVPHHLSKDSVSYDSLVSTGQINQSGCDLGGLPHISAPVNVKHVIHVAPGLIKRSELRASSVEMFPFGFDRDQNFHEHQPSIAIGKRSLPGRGELHVFDSDFYQRIKTSLPVENPTEIPPSLDQSFSNDSPASTVNRSSRFGLRTPVHRTISTSRQSTKRTSTSFPAGTDNKPTVMIKTWPTRILPVSRKGYTQVSPQYSKKRFPVNSSLFANSAQLKNECEQHCKPVIGHETEFSDQPQIDEYEQSFSNLDEIERHRSASGPPAQSPCHSTLSVEVPPNSTEFSSNSPSLESSGDLLHPWTELSSLLAATGGTNLLPPFGGAPPSGDYITRSSRSLCVSTALWSAFRVAAIVPCLKIHESNERNLNEVHARKPDNQEQTLDSSVAQQAHMHYLKHIPPSIEHTYVHRSHTNPDEEPENLFSNRFLPHSNSGDLLKSRLRRIQSVDRQKFAKRQICSCLHCRTIPEAVDENLISCQAVFGDPHSPFLGTLVGSGRSPYPASHISRLKHTCDYGINKIATIGSSVPVNPDLTARSKVSSHNCTPCCYREVEALKRMPVVDAIPKSNRCLLDIDTSWSVSDRALESGSVINSPTTCCCQRGCSCCCHHQSIESWYSCQRSETVDEISGSDPLAPSCHVVTSHKNVCNNLVSAPDSSNSPLASRSAVCHLPKSTSNLSQEHTIFDPKPHNLRNSQFRSPSSSSLSAADFNPVGISRDAYLKVTQDGYLNHRNSPVSYESRYLIQSNQDSFRFNTDQFEPSEICCRSDHNLLKQCQESYPLEDLDYDDSDDSLDETDWHNSRIVPTDDDGLTLVPNDGLEPHDSHYRNSLHHSKCDGISSSAQEHHGSSRNTDSADSIALCQQILRQHIESDDMSVQCSHPVTSVSMQDTYVLDDCRSGSACVIKQQTKKESESHCGGALVSPHVTYL